MATKPNHPWRRIQRQRNKRPKHQVNLSQHQYAQHIVIRITQMCLVCIVMNRVELSLKEYVRVRKNS